MNQYQTQREKKIILIFKNQILKNKNLKLYSFNFTKIF